MEKKIIIKGARENNLKNIDLELPTNSLIVMSGLSGSGKSSLAFDTIYAEGQRRYVESLSPYARQFLGGIRKPAVDSIEGLSPAISIDQKTTSHNPRSTVGTVTEIYDYFRLLFARIGTPYCPTHNIPIVGNTIEEIKEKVLSFTKGSKIKVLSPIVVSKVGSFKDVINKYFKLGIIRAYVDDNELELEEYLDEGLNKAKHDISLVVDRMVLNEENSERLFEAIELATGYSEGLVDILIDDKKYTYSTNYSCPHCGFTIGKLTPRLFSFNAPAGACNCCKGLGVKISCDYNVMVPNDELSINEGAISYFKNIIDSENIEWKEFEVLIDYYKIDRNKPFKDLNDDERNIVLYGSKEPISYTITTRSGNKMKRNDFIEGPAARIERLYVQTTSPMLRDWYYSFMMESECPECHGTRLNQKPLSVLIDGENIATLCKKSISDIYAFLQNMNISEVNREISKLLVDEISNRLKFLINVGLDYLTLDRVSSTLSGGEAQRIRLATQIGSKLTGVLYVLDEPSIGLHQKDNDRLIETMKSMRDLGNTIIVVEHDEDTIKAADYIVDIGPRAGINGGEVVACGKLDDIKNAPLSITGRYLKGVEKIDIPANRRKGNGEYLEIIGATSNNLKNINVKIPLHTFTVVTGVSGSGKSTLVNETIYQNLHKIIYKARHKAGAVKEIKGADFIDKLINITQEPIGRTPRSNPATYTGAFDLIRDIFANTTDAKIKGYSKSRFSFNVRGGRCERCEGDGVIRVPMQFLPDVFVPCEVCNGKRYNEETLKVKFKDKSIFDVLDMPIDEAYDFFINQKKIADKIKVLKDVGLGYIKLGQNAVTLSGGEAQRVKLAFELSKKPTGKTLYILDEPTTGLHVDDVKRLLVVIEKIVNNGDSVIMIEHNLDCIKCADYVIDLGPDGGNKGGNVIATGTPEDIAKVKGSYTGYYLNKILH